MVSKQKSEILLVGRDLSANGRLRRELLARACEVATAAGGEEGLAQATSHGFDVVVSDLLTPGLSGLEMLKQLHAANPRLPIILIDKDANVESAIEATKLGVYEYVVTPVKTLELLEHIIRAASARRGGVSALEVDQAEATQNGLVGSSPVMQELYKQIGLAAGSFVTILIRGATGTGKELVAKAIHQHSNRAHHRLIAVNCSAIPETLLENELFGHEAGAFTGASTRQSGRFEQADGGTLFLDEIGDLSLAMQVKLLRVLEEGRIQRLGGSQEIAPDVRVIAATHRDLESLVESGQFRCDLFYRLDGLTIQTPELRDHRDDILGLTRHFLRRWQIDQSLEPLPICREAVEFFERQAWPGNVRELEHAVYRAALLARGQAIELVHAQEACGNKKPFSNTARRYRPEPLTDLVERARAGEVKDLRARVLEQADRSLLDRVMGFAHGNQAKMARWLGVTRTTVHQLLCKFGFLAIDQSSHSHQCPPKQIPPNQIGPQASPTGCLEILPERDKGSGPGSLGR
jgi:DNA-binding NtrC family response regulator